MELLKQTQQQRKRQREKAAAEEESAAKKQKIEGAWLFPLCSSLEPVPVPVFQSTVAPADKINVVEDDIPADFFDDRAEQAKVVAASTAQKVTNSGAYSTTDEREEEERALRDLVLELEKKKEEEAEQEEDNEEPMEDEDEVVGVVDLQYEPVHEPLSILPQKFVKETPRDTDTTTTMTTTTTTNATNTTEITANNEDTQEQEYERYIRALEEEKRFVYFTQTFTWQEKRRKIRRFEDSQLGETEEDITWRCFNT